MKEKLKLTFNDEKKRLLLILIIVAIILSICLTIVAYTISINQKDKKTTTSTTTTSSTKQKDIFHGFDTKSFDFDSTPIKVNYDLKSTHEFIYANGADRSTIYTNYKGQELFYELNLDNGKIVFKEQRYNINLKAYEFTSKNYSFADATIKDYLVVSTCEKDRYSIIAKDDKSNIYVFDSPNEEFGIDYIISNIKKKKVISKVSKVGYYNYNNYPHRECNEFDLVYLDTVGNVRFISDNNAIFFENAYYRFVGHPDGGNFIYVLKDGLMKYESGENKFLNDGNSNITYMGSFYTLDNESADIYILGTNGYVYKIADFGMDSSVIMTPINKKRIKKIGTRIVKDENDYATDNKSVKIEFENNEVLEFSSVYEFELLS